MGQERLPTTKVTKHPLSVLSYPTPLAINVLVNRVITFRSPLLRRRHSAMTKNLPQRPRHSANGSNAQQTNTEGDPIAVPVVTYQQGISGGAPVEKQKPVDDNESMVSSQSRPALRPVTNASSYYTGGRYSGHCSEASMIEDGSTAPETYNDQPSHPLEGDFGWDCKA